MLIHNNIIAGYALILLACLHAYYNYFVAFDTEETPEEFDRNIIIDNFFHLIHLKSQESMQHLYQEYIIIIRRESVELSI